MAYTKCSCKDWEYFTKPQKNQKLCHFCGKKLITIDTKYVVIYEPREEISKNNLNFSEKLVTLKEFKIRNALQQHQQRKTLFKIPVAKENIVCPI